MRSLLLASVVLASGCAAPAPDLEPTPSPDLEPTPSPTPALRFRTPGPEAVNPVTFTVDAPEGATSVRYLSQGITTLGESSEAALGFPLTHRFDLLGENVVEAWAFSGDTYLGDARLAFTVSPDPAEANDFGLWVRRPEDLPSPVDALAERLGRLGVSRIYLPVGEGLTDCEATPMLCDHTITDAFRAAGVLPYAWGVPDLSDPMGQANLLFEIVPAGYHGLVLSVDDRWTGRAEELADLALSYVVVRSQCDTSGAHLAGEFPLYAAHAADLGEDEILALDGRFDGFMPRLDPRSQDPVDVLCALRRAGATRPIHPVLDLVELGDGPERERILSGSGRRLSFSALPAPEDADGQAALEALPWGWDAFEPPGCP